MSNRWLNTYVETIAVVDKEQNLTSIWSIEKFEQRLSVLRDICEFYMEEKDGEGFSMDIIFNSSDYLMFIESNEDEWQSYDEFIKDGDKFSKKL